MSRRWEQRIPDADRAVHRAAGYGKTLGLGTQPAALIIDVNYRFLGRRPLPILESVRLWPKSSGEHGWKAIPSMRHFLALGRSTGIPVIFTTGQGQRLGGPQAHKSRQQGEGGEGTDDLDVVADLAPQPGELIIRKPGPSAFFGTALLPYLIQRGVDTLLVAGCTTSGCVRATTVDAATLGFRVGVVEEGVFDRFEISHDVALFDLNAKYADVMSLDQIEGYLSAGRAASVRRS